MSFYFEEVYFPLINNLLVASQMKQYSRNPSQNKKYSLQDSDSSRKKMLSNSNKKSSPNSINSKNQRNLPSNLGFTNLSHQSNKKTQIMNIIDENQQYLNGDLIYYQENFELNQMNTQSNIHQENSRFILQKKNENASKQKAFHNGLKQSLICNASSYSKSQRLQTIFESTRKQKSQMSRSKTFENKKNKKAKLVEIDETSRKNIRKSFCLKMVVNDEEWEDTYSKSLRDKN